MNRKVISSKQLPIRPAGVIWTGITMGLLLDRLSAPQWLWGALGFFWVASFILLLVAALTSEHIELKELK